MEKANRNNYRHDSSWENSNLEWSTSEIANSRFESIDNAREFNRKIGLNALRMNERVSDKKYETIGRAELFEILESDFRPKNLMDYSDSPENIEAWLFDNLTQERETYGDNLKVGVVSGSFDVPQGNHAWYLKHCKVLLAQKFCQEKSIEATANNINYVIEQGIVKLIVAVDSDQEISNRKSKPGDIRPIYNFSERSRKIADLNISFEGSNQSVADFVVAEGPEYAGSSLEKLPYLAGKGKSAGLIDEFICFGEHPSSADSAKSIGFDPILIPQSVVYATDDNGIPYSSSGIIDKIKAGGVNGL